MKKMITRRNFLKAAGVSAAALGLAACGGSSSSTASSAASSTAASASASASGASGKVYYLNFKPEQDQAWQDLAAAYTKETGVPVTVVTAASGQYETTLMSEMEKSEAPTLFQVNGPVGLANWKDYCYDLSGSKLYGELTSDSFALKDGDAVTSIAYVIETYGIIYNKELLTAAGYTQDDIKGFDDLKKVADDIQARKAELGVDGAFTSAGMDGSSDWRFKTHLANLPIYYEYKADGISSTDAIKGTYLDNYKQIWDLYITDSTCDPKLLASKTGNDAVAEFVGKKAVFYQNGTWAYSDVSSLGDDNLGMLPIYIGVDGEENQGLCTGSENYWCVNNTASDEDIQARKAELGVDGAFTSAGMDGSSDWRFKTHLANLPIYYEYKADGISSTDAIKGTYLDDYKQIWDLYITDSTCDPKLLASKTGDDAVAEFVGKKAVFYQNGTWAYNDVKDLGDDNLGMLPIYIGVDGEENQGLCTGSENFWCVNNTASEADIQATLDFLYWCVTSETGTSAMADKMGFVIPFKKAKDSTNPLITIANQYVADGKTSVDWCFSTMPSEEWKNGVGSALTAYAAGTGKWDDVVTAFVDGWAKEYKLANG